MECSVAMNRDTVQLCTATAVVDACLTKSHKNIIWVILHTHKHTHIHTHNLCCYKSGSSIVSTRGDERALIVFLNLGANHTNIFSL